MNIKNIIKNWFLHIKSLITLLWGDFIEDWNKTQGLIRVAYPIINFPLFIMYITAAVIIGGFLYYPIDEIIKKHKKDK